MRTKMLTTVAILALVSTQAVADTVRFAGGKQLLSPGDPISKILDVEKPVRYKSVEMVCPNVQRLRCSNRERTVAGWRYYFKNFNNLYHVDTHNGIVTSISRGR